MSSTPFQVALWMERLSLGVGAVGALVVGVIGAIGGGMLRDVIG